MTLANVCLLPPGLHKRATWTSGWKLRRHCVCRLLSVLPLAWLPLWAHCLSSRHVSNEIKIFWTTTTRTGPNRDPPRKLHNVVATAWKASTLRCHFANAFDRRSGTLRPASSNRTLQSQMSVCSSACVPPCPDRLERLKSPLCRCGGPFSGTAKERGPTVLRQLFQCDQLQILQIRVAKADTPGAHRGQPSSIMSLWTDSKVVELNGSVRWRLLQTCWIYNPPMNTRVCGRRVVFEQNSSVSEILQLYTVGIHDKSKQILNRIFHNRFKAIA